VAAVTAPVASRSARRSAWREALLGIFAAGVATGCSQLEGFGGAVPPLARVTVAVTPPDPAVAPLGHPRVALVWGMQWLTEAFCILPPETTAAGAVQLVGCRDPFGFVPARVEADVAVTPGTPATIELFTLPGADVLVGDVTARAAYGTIVVYDDLNGDQTLNLARPNRLTNPGGPPVDPTNTHQPDVVRGASFVSMTAPDQRVAFREGVFLPGAAFYPRAGCGEPPPAFSVLAASGFTRAEALQATLAGTLPQEDDLTRCAQAAPADATIALTVQAASTTLTEVACTERTSDSSVRYLEPRAIGPDLAMRQSACVHLPTFGTTPSPTIELIVSGRADDACASLSHYVLKGCNNDPGCAVPTWDHSLAPPTWWPCGAM
jgi:hypothetical protein